MNEKNKKSLNVSHTCILRRKEGEDVTETTGAYEQDFLKVIKDKPTDSTSSSNTEQEEVRVHLDW